MLMNYLSISMYAIALKMWPGSLTVLHTFYYTGENRIIYCLELVDFFSSYNKI